MDEASLAFRSYVCTLRLSIPHAVTFRLIKDLSFATGSHPVSSHNVTYVSANYDQASCARGVESCERVSLFLLTAIFVLALLPALSLCLNACCGIFEPGLCEGICNTFEGLLPELQLNGISSPGV